MDAMRRQQGHEVFHKASLSLPGSSKQRRKAILAKPKSSSSKSKVKSRDMLGVLRNIENTGRGVKPAKKLLVCEQQASLNSDLRPSLNSDLRRVLGHSPLRTPQQDTPLTEVSTKLSQGLATCTLFPNSTYLSSAKAEIRKIMKQSNNETYSQLKIACVGPTSTSHPLYCSLLSGLHAIEAVDSDDLQPVSDSSPQFMLDSLALETGTSFLLEPPPSDTSFLLDPPPSDLLDLMDSGEPEWSSPIKRPRLFPQKLY